MRGAKMILFSSKKLEKALAEDSLDEREKAKYMIYPNMLYAFATPFFLAQTVSDHPNEYYFNFIFTLISVLIFYLVFRTCYRINGNSMNKNFIENIVVLSVPAWMKVFVIFASLSIYFLIRSNGLPFLKDNLSFFMSSLGFFATLTFSILIIRSFRNFEKLQSSSAHSEA
jgi:hypothetical protein